MAGNFYDGLSGIPIDYLVAAPLMAAARANLALANNLEEFIFQIGFGQAAPGTSNGPALGSSISANGAANAMQPLLISFNLSRPYMIPNSGQMSVQTISVSAPLIALVPIPALLVDNVTVNFTTNISTTTTSNESVTTNAGVSYGYLGFHVAANVTAAANHMRTSNQSATYNFSVTANQQATPEGMSALMDVVTSCIQPIPVGS